MRVILEGPLCTAHPTGYPARVEAQVCTNWAIGRSHMLQHA